jgi:hypothetical protein
MKDAAKRKHMVAPEYLGRKIVGKDPLPYTFADLQFQIEQSLKHGLTKQEIFTIEWQLIEQPSERLRILNHSIAVAAERLAKNTD